MKLVLLGIQGAGKSTQGNLLSHQLHIPYLSTGHIFREIAKEKTTIGRYMKETVNAGILVPDNKAIEIVHEYLSRSEYRSGYILDGFPRTIDQARRFKNNLDRVIYLEVPDREALWRLAYRNDTTREDETLTAIKKRIELFHKYTRPVIEFYRKKGKLVIIDGSKDIRQVNKDILQSLGRQLVKGEIKKWEQGHRKIILAIVGLPGAGKTAAADYFAEKGVPVIEFGKIVNDYIDKHRLEHTEENHKKMREGLRIKYGREAFAMLNEKKIRNALSKNFMVAIDGMRSWEEYTFLKSKFENVKLIVLALYADKELRYKRISKRRYRSHLAGEERDIDELIGINMAPTIGFADYFVDANSTLEDLKDKLEAVYRVIYFSNGGVPS